MSFKSVGAVSYTPEDCNISDYNIAMQLIVYMKTFDNSSGSENI